MLATLWLATLLIGLAAWTVHDKREYATFKTVQESEARRAFYRRWTWQSFVFLVGATTVTLFVLDAENAIFGVPAAFADIATALVPSAKASKMSGDGTAGFAIGLFIGIAILVLVQARRVRKMMVPVIGDIEPLIPRNRAEMLAVLPLCINAGVSEELFFRLALPMLIAHVTGSAIVGLVGAAVLFGLIHAYQGWKGVIATMVVGAVLTLVYLRSGSIFRPMMLHALMDVVALIVRPLVTERLARSRRARPASAA